MNQPRNMNIVNVSPLSPPADARAMLVETPVHVSEEQHAVSKISGSLFQYLGNIALLLFCIIPGLVFSYIGVQEPWTLFRIARVNLSLSADYIARFVTHASGYRAEHIGGEMVQTALLKLSSWPLEWIGLVPIGSLLLGLCFYGVAVSLSGSKWVAGATAIFATWYYPTLYSDYGTQTYVWVHVMFIVFVLLVRHWLTSKSPFVSILLMLVFVATFWHYHSTPIWMIAVVSVAALGSWLQTKGPGRVAIPKSWSLSLFCLVLYLAFDTVTYQEGLGQLRSGLAGELLPQNIWSRVFAPFHLNQSAQLPPYAVAPTSPAIATYSTLAVLMLLSLPTCVWICEKIYRSLRTRSLHSLVSSLDEIIVWAILAATASHMLLYIAYGAFSPRLIPLAFPIILPLALKKFSRIRWVSPAFAFALAAISIVGFVSYVPSFIPDVLASETGFASKLISDGAKVLGDATVYGDVLLRQAEDGKISDLVWLDSDNYAAVVGQQPVSDDDFDYAAIDKRGKPLTSSKWMSFQPWTNYMDQISNNTQLNKVYDSDKLTLMQRLNVPLATYSIDQGAIHPTNPPFVEQALHMFLAVVLIALLPGLPIVWIFRKKGSMASLNASSLIGIGIATSISVVTFIGYVVNSTSLSLGWFVPLLTGLAISLLGIALLYSRGKGTLTPSLPFVLSVLVVMFIWAILATYVAEERTRQHSDYTEFFLTQNSSPGCVDFNVVNRLNEPGRFTVDVRINSVETASGRYRELAPYSSWTETVCGVGPNSLLLTLAKDKELAGELRLSPDTSSTLSKEGSLIP